MITLEKERILIISPHADDEVLGCGGLIEKACRNENHVKVVVMSVGNIKHNHLDEIVTGQIRTNELKAAMEYLNCDDFQIIYKNKDSLLDTIPKQEVISKLEEIIKQFNPTMVFIPLPSYHQDHKVLFEASIAALRPNLNQTIKLIAMYEYSLITWQYEKFWNTGELYLDISKTVHKKINALKKHKSQLRPKNHLISPETVLKWAEMRGIEVGLHYAEKYYILRSIIS